MTRTNYFNTFCIIIIIIIITVIVVVIIIIMVIIIVMSEGACENIPAHTFSHNPRKLDTFSHNKSVKNASKTALYTQYIVEFGNSKEI